MTRWRQARFSEVIHSRGAGTSGLPQSEWGTAGKYPVIGQGAEYIEGWTDREDLVVRPSPALVLYGGHTRRAKLVDRPFVPGPNVKILEPSSDLDAAFLFRFLEQLEIESRGYADHFSEVRRQRVPVPPLSEQRRIAEILDKADALRAKRRAALAQLDTLTQSIFLDMFGDPATNPKGWSVVPLGDLMTEVYRYPTYYDIKYVEDGVPEIRGELLNEDGTVITDPGALRYISPETTTRFPRTVLAEGDLVMSVRGTVGKLAVVPAALSGANITANLLRLAPDRNQAHPVYAWHYMRTAWFRAQLANACSNTTIQTIKAPDLKRIGVMRPPIDYQGDFNRVVDSIRYQKTVAAAGMVRLESLFASVQYRAFRGEL